MMVSLSGALLRFADYKRDHQLEAATAMGAIEALTQRYPKMKTAIFDENGGVRSFNLVYINKEPATKESLVAPGSPDDKVEIITAIAGG